MRCHYCGKQIGLWARWRYRQFCSAAHYRAGGLHSARAARDSEIFGSAEWDIYNSLALNASTERKQPKSGPGFSPILMVPLLLFGMLALQFLPEGSVPQRVASYTLPQGGAGVWNSIRSVWPGGPGTHLQSDFHSGIVEWGASAKGAGQDAEFASGSLRPGRLRLWKPSMSLSDYRFEFQGEIESKGLGWAFRASNQHNYYAAKLNVGSSLRGEIVRYAVLNGREGNRSELPLPMAVRTGTPYKVRVSVKGDLFTTAINGQLVDTWRDGRLRSGGIGFFADKGDLATIRWASVTSGDPGFLSRLFASTLFIAPADLLNDEQ